MPTRLPGGSSDATFGDIPPATEGSCVLGLKWTDETDRKVEYGYRFAPPTTFDLAGQDQIAFDVLIPAGAPLPGDDGIALWDSDLGWRDSENLPTETGKWFTIVIDATDLENEGLDELDAVVFRNIGEPEDKAGTIFVDNLRLRRMNPAYYKLSAVSHDCRIDLRWQANALPGNSTGPHSQDL